MPGAPESRYNWVMATAEKTVYPHVMKDPEVCSGRACVQGTRVRVMDVVALQQDGLTPEQIVAEFPSLGGPTDVYAALVYYADHKDEIDGDFAEDERLADEADQAEQRSRRSGR